MVNYKKKCLTNNYRLVYTEYQLEGAAETRREGKGKMKLQSKEFVKWYSQNINRTPVNVLNVVLLELFAAIGIVLCGILTTIIVFTK